MPYNALLNTTITESKLTIKEIAERCKAYGVNITAAYISALKNNADRTPSDNVSRAIAKACGISENLLVLEAYIDNSPEEFRSMIGILRDIVVIGAISVYENAYPPEVIAATKQSMLNMPMANLVQQIASMDQDAVNKLVGAFNMTSTSYDDDGNTSTLAIAQPSGIPVMDDAMAPIIPKGSTVTPLLREKCTEYQNGDILCYKRIEDKQLSIRQVTFLNDDHTRMTMAPYNNAYSVEVLNVDDIIIIGKVVKMIVDFK